MGRHVFGNPRENEASHGGPLGIVGPGFDLIETQKEVLPALPSGKHAFRLTRARSECKALA
jgi:hypothetical protein